MSYTDHRPVLIIIAGPNGSGKTTITSKILRHEWIEDAVYIKAAYLNGKKLNYPYINYEDIKDGATLHFEMSRKPVKGAFKVS